MNNSNIDSIHKCQTNTMQNSVLGNRANSDYLAYKMNVSWTAFQMRLGMQQLSFVFFDRSVKNSVTIIRNIIGLENI